LKQLCNSSYIWDVFADFDIFVANANDVIEKRLTASPGYDAEGTVSPQGDRIVFTSMRSGDLELWTMKLDGTDLKQVTNVLGYGRRFLLSRWPENCLQSVETNRS